jgi:hypothetical protein
MKDLISNCFLCEEHSLHVVGVEEAQVMQCINCGYVSSTKFIGKKETNEEYKKLPDDMKSWAVEKNDRIWIPTIMTLPVGMLYPFNEEKVAGDGTQTIMKWAFAPMVEIPEEEQEKYPNENGGYYEKRIDTDNTNIYDIFVDGLAFVNELMKNKSIDGGE